MKTLIVTAIVGATLIITIPAFARGGGGGHSGGSSHTSGGHSSGGAHVSAPKTTHVAAHVAMPKTTVKPTSSTTHVKTYVKPTTGKVVVAHDRTTPNKTQKDNWSSKPNVNPETGKAGTKTPKK